MQSEVLGVLSGMHHHSANQMGSMDVVNAFSCGREKV